ncbi:hypothetical protein MESS4_560025 [Mesorhizobium sp. STM 4661]|nr:hypothetical protein MESS4_560025 [Mesorhizobium sp. STM 4661]
MQRRRENQVEIAAAYQWQKFAEDAGLSLKTAAVDLGERTSVRLIAEQTGIQANREAIAAEALQDVKLLVHEGRATDTSARQPDTEWLDRYWRLAGEISRSDFQALWGRVLARKITGTADIGARTLDFVSTLSRSEARLIERLAACVCYVQDPEDWAFIHSLPNGFPKNTPNEVINNKLAMMTVDLRDPNLGSLGIYHEEGFAHSTYIKIVDGKARISIAGKQFEISSSSGKWPGDYEGYCHLGSGHGVSQLGRELLALIDVQPNNEYLEVLVAGLVNLGLRLDPATQTI